MNLTPSARALLLAIISTAWTVGALGLLNFVLIQLSSGSNLGFRFPIGGPELDLIPIMIWIAATAIAAGVVSLTLIMLRARRSAPAA